MTGQSFRACSPAWAVGVVWACTGPAAAQPSITDLGVLPGGISSGAGDVSAHGSIVVGGCELSSGATVPFRWSNGSMQNLPMLVGAVNSWASGVSDDGRVVVGAAQFPSYYRAFRWTNGGALQNLGLVPGLDSMYAHALSADGGVVVGEAFNALPPSDDRGFRWTSATGLTQVLLPLPGGSDSGAYGISDDGSVVVGHTFTPGTGYRAVRWPAGGGPEDLGVPPGGSDSFARGVSGDGAVVVGGSFLPEGRRAFRWTSAGGMRSLGVFQGFSDSEGARTNHDGSSVVGYCRSQAGVHHAFLWTPTLGMVDLNSYLPTLGVNLDGWTLRHANGISPDGSAIVGDGVLSGAFRGWIVTGLPSFCYPDCDTSTGPGVLDIFDFLCFQNRFDARDPYACDCDTGGGPLTCDIFDFLCFQNAFAAGCP